MKYVFASKEWFAAAHGILAQRASCLATLGIKERVSICETYRDMPTELGWPDNQITWSCVYEDGNIEFALCERDDVDFKVTGTYSAFRSFASYVVGKDPARVAEYRKLAMAGIASGEIEILSGNGFREPGNLESFHDVLARLTCA
jgi:hypothetical protein